MLQLATVTRRSFVQAIPSTSAADRLDGHEHLHPREFTVPDVLTKTIYLKKQD